MYGRYTRYSDYYPTPFKYQYRYFYPTPIYPATSGVNQAPRTHICGLANHDHGCKVWESMASKCGSFENEIAAVRDHALKKSLPWRVNPSKDVDEDPSIYTTGRKSNGYYKNDIFGTDENRKFPELVKESNICAAHGNKTYTWSGAKVSPHEWHVNNQQLNSGADCVHNLSEMVKSQARRCIGETKNGQIRSNNDTSKDLDIRIEEIESWIIKLQEELKYNTSETNEMIDLKERLEVMIKNIETPLEISQDNLYTREGRLGAELVRDAVEESLLTEIEAMKKCQEMLIGYLDKVNEKLGLLRAARHELEKDISNKKSARETDECVKVLSSLRNEIGPIQELDKAYDHLARSFPTTWVQNTQALIQRSQYERDNSDYLMAETTRGMIACANKCFDTWYSTNNSFSTRINEIEKAKCVFDQKYVKVKNDISSLCLEMKAVMKALDAKKPAMDLVQARLEKRKERPGFELCHDKVTMALYKELHTLKVAKDQLNGQLEDMKATMNELQKTKSALEHDLKLKEKALFVDRDKCLTHRHNYPISNFKDVRFQRKQITGGDSSSETNLMRDLVPLPRPR